MFQADKTSSIHCVRRTQAEPEAATSLVFGSQSIQASGSVKVLGVTLDSRLRKDRHVGGVTSPAIEKCMALR